MIRILFLCLLPLISCQNVTVPSFPQQNLNCVIPGIDPTTIVSMEAFQNRGKVDNCQTLCTTEYLFNCTSFTWGGVSSYCILHGRITQNLLTPKFGSTYNLYDNQCLLAGTGASSFKLCVFEDRGVSIAAPGDAKYYSKVDQADCQAACETDAFTSCSSYGFDTNISFLMGAKNCITFRRSNSTITMPSGTFRLYENRCLLKMVNCI